MSDRIEGGVDDDALPPHIHQTVQAIARLHAAHDRRATNLQRMVDRLATVFAEPWFIASVTFAVFAWVGGNLVSRRLFGVSLDREGFPSMQIAGELLAIYITSLVLMSQRRKDELSELREQLTLELVILTEQKVAKLIELQEEARRDNPMLINRVDPQAEAMAAPADPEAVLVAFKETHGNMVSQPDEAWEAEDAVSLDP